MTERTIRRHCKTQNFSCKLFITIPVWLRWMWKIIFNVNKWIESNTMGHERKDILMEMIEMFLCVLIHSPWKYLYFVNHCFLEWTACQPKDNSTISLNLYFSVNVPPQESQISLSNGEMLICKKDFALSLSSFLEIDVAMLEWTLWD